MKRFREDRTLAPVVAQFVPLHLDTGKPEWQQFARKFPHEGGNAIPIVYIIRADGEKLYARTGAPKGEQLPQLLVASLSAAGSSLNPQQAEWFKEAAEELAASIEQEDDEATIALIQTASKQGDPTQLGTYAAPAVKFQQLVVGYVESFQSTLESQRTGWEELSASQADEESWFDAAESLAEFQQKYRSLSITKSELGKAVAEFRRIPEGRARFASAEVLVKGRLEGETPAKRERAAKKLLRLIDGEEDSVASARARGLLEEWGMDEASLRSAPTQEVAAELREWKDRTGKFSVQARLVEVSDEAVTLEREDGQTIEVPLDWLSTKDRSYLRRLEKDR